MKSLIVVLALVSVAFAGSEIVKDNKTPKDIFTTTCDECQSLVKRFVEAAKDPAKLAELKLLLGYLCTETSYEQECKLIVSKLEYFIKRLEPYLQDTERVCKKIHLCANPKINQFHRIAVLFAKKYMNSVDRENGVMCEECKFAVDELKAIVEQKEKQEEIKHFISEEFCRRLGKYQGSCDLVLEEFLPELFEELDKFLQNSQQVCSDVGMCSASESVQKNKEAAKAKLDKFVAKAVSLKTSQPNIYMSCLECKIIMDSLLIELRTNNSIHSIANDLRDGVCPKLPADFLDGCDDFLSLYAPTVVMMTLQQFTSEGLCEGFHTCDAGMYAKMNKISSETLNSVKCESCTGIVKFLKDSAANPEISGEIQKGFVFYACDNVPSEFTNLCENVAMNVIPRVFNYIAKSLNSNTICHDDLHMC